MAKRNPKPEDGAPAMAHCAQCKAIADAEAAHKAAAVAERAAARATAKTAQAAEAAKAARPREMPLRRKILAAAVLAAALAIWANIAEAADVRPVYLAVIGHHNGAQTIGHMASAAACIEFTKAIGPFVAYADCHSVATYSGAAYIPPQG
jgi:hypothetical protein